MRKAADRAAFITRNLAVGPVPDLPGILIYQAHPGSGLSRLGGVAPYWAYVWAGGTALARFVLESGVARGQRVLDFGAGSGVVAIAAARAGAAGVRAAERDPWGRSAVMLNAALNGVSVPLARGRPRVDLVLCGDVFYGPEAAAAVLPVLEGYRASGARVLVGDPGRADLPLSRLTRLAEYQVRDIGDGPGVVRTAGVFAFG